MSSKRLEITTTKNVELSQQRNAISAESKMQISDSVLLPILKAILADGNGALKVSEIVAALKDVWILRHVVHEDEGFDAVEFYNHIRRFLVRHPYEFLTSREDQVFLRQFLSTSERDLLKAGKNIPRVFNNRRVSMATGLQETLNAHSNIVTCVMCSSDGTMIASGSYDKTVRVWCATTGMLIATLVGHNRSVTCVAFSSDSSVIASGSIDRTVHLWDSHFQPFLILRGHSDGVASLAFSADDRAIITGFYDSSVAVWDAANGRLLHSFKAHTLPVTSIAISPEYDFVVSGSLDKTIAIWSTATSTVTVVLDAKDCVTSIAMQADGKRFLSSHWDWSIRVWGTSSSEVELVLVGHSDCVTSAVFDPTGSRIYSGSWDRTVRIWDATYGTLLHTLHGHTDDVFSVCCAADGSRVVSSSRDKTIRIWCTSTFATMLIVSYGINNVTTDSMISPALGISIGHIRGVLLEKFCTRRNVFGGTSDETSIFGSQSRAVDDDTNAEDEGLPS
jgi:WD40 repeat protein